MSHKKCFKIMISLQIVNISGISFVLKAQLRSAQGVDLKCSEHEKSSFSTMKLRSARLPSAINLITNLTLVLNYFPRAGWPHLSPPPGGRKLDRCFAELYVFEIG